MKMLKVSDVFAAVDSLAPFAYKSGNDNIGLLVGSESAPVTKVLVALDITRETAEEAARYSCELIVSHHPVIFSPLSTLPDGSVPYLLAARGISAICAHSNLDAAKGGVSDTLAAALGLQNIEGFELPDGSDPVKTGRIGTLPAPLRGEDFAGFAAERLGYARYTPGGEILRVAVIGGAGSDWLPAAAALGADAFVTGEIKHHIALEAVRLGVMAVECGHFATENIICPVLGRHIEKSLPELKVYLSKQGDPFEGIKKSPLRSGE